MTKDAQLSRRAAFRLAAAGGAAAAIAPFAAVSAYAGPQYVVAAHGYDVVAYFEQGGPARGQTNLTTSYNGATWLFTSAENKAKFDADPSKYAPQYDGYCAFAAALGYKAPGDPEAWTVHDGKLYLNVNKRAREVWSKDIPGNVAKADENWPKLNKV